MAVFTYRALDAHRSVLTGTLAADSPRAARDRLRAQGLRIERFEPVVPVGADRPAWMLARSRRRYEAQVLTLVREVATLLAVGLPLLDGLDTALLSTKGPLQARIQTLRDRVEGGASLAEAMREQPDVFDDLTVTLTEVGQASGRLDEILEELVRFREASVQFRDRVTTALLYPFIVGSIGVAVAVFLMTFVVPQLLDGLVEADRELPWITVAVKTVSDGLTRFWWLLTLGVVGSGVGMIALLSRPKGRALWHRFLMRVPGVGDLIRKQAMVRVAVVLATLLRSGLSFTQSLKVARSSARNAVIEDALRRAEDTIQSGGDISQALEDTRAFTPVVVQVFSVGQASGRLEEMLDRLAKDYDRQVTTATGRLTAVLEPAMIVTLAVGIGIIAFAVILPILEAGNVM